MVDWKSPEEIEKDSAALVLGLHVIFGIYVWEWFISLDFDWQYISGKKKIRLPAILYLLNRYCMLFSLIGLSIALNVTKEVNCQVLYTFNQIFGNAAIGLSSINLSLRTMAVWSGNKYLVAFLIFIILGHWSFLIRGMILRVGWIDGVGCTIIAAPKTLLLNASFIYSMAFDFAVLCLTAYKLLSMRDNYSRLVDLILHDGLVYFLISFLVNLTATIFMIVNLNPVMVIIANVPAATISAIAACRVSRRLSQFLSQDVQVFGEDGIKSTVALRFKMPSFLSKTSTNNEGAGLRAEVIKKPLDREPPVMPGAEAIPDPEAQTRET